ncbi:CoA-transferase [Corynebacterium sp. HMSC077D10]|uniref:CaiB/BaiF CoA transferase family protein n=1 Tax=unclassified Corynebacterium TaxID=2624378 RepID=UPI000794B1C7|nr:MULTISPECIES: CaiB/BaiF CoA-transferase family protein [unclassified Corynebacterium]KXB52295.1 III protein, CoA-transferase family [Corynebacterium sp. DNF00584]OFL80068.1 CoA-transferase [Corynebacterium sp. HMSC077B05]OFP19664.1 CoA-transferase [Corynebacterium sp. HMSC065A05]OFP68288.1 CoA-transferase [Corynebacterium sp. HMSC077D10]
MLPLTGITVVHLGGIGPGPFAAMILADMGARVIRVVRPGNPADIVPHGVLYRGQETLEANLKDPDDVARVLDLITDAQLLIEGFRPSVAERLGLGPSDAASRNPALVYGRMTGWGQDGPLAQTAGHDINYIAISGALGAIAAPDGRPVPPLNFMGDFGGGSMYLVSGLLAALVHAQTTGEGAVVDANIVDGAASLTAMLHAFRNAGQWGPTGTNVLDGGAPFYTVYKTSDGKWMSVGAIEPQFYAELLRLLDLTNELAGIDQNDQAEWPRVAQHFAEVFVTKTQAEWVKIFRGTDACVAEVVSPDDVLDHPHLAARGTYRPTSDGMEPAPAPRISPLA